VSTTEPYVAHEDWGTIQPHVSVDSGHRPTWEDLMRWLRVIVTAAILLIPIASGSAGASQTEGVRPRIVSLEWTTTPLTAGAVEALEIRAVDLDGVITTVNILWGDGPFTHADLICFQPGEVARVLLTHRYTQPGLYRVQVVVRSGPRCFTTRQTSPEETAPALVLR
jgi:hypothetical protein